MKLSMHMFEVIGYGSTKVPSLHEQWTANECKFERAEFGNYNLEPAG